MFCWVKWLLIASHGIGEATEQKMMTQGEIPMLAHSKAVTAAISPAKSAPNRFLGAAWEKALGLAKASSFVFSSRVPVSRRPAYITIPMTLPAWRLGIWVDLWALGYGSLRIVNMIQHLPGDSIVTFAVSFIHNMAPGNCNLASARNPMSDPP